MALLSSNRFLQRSGVYIHKHTLNSSQVQGETKKGRDTIHVTPLISVRSRPFDLRASVLCWSTHYSLYIRSGMPLAWACWGPFCLCPLLSLGQLHQGKAKLKATWGVPKLSFIQSRSDLFSMQCKFLCLKTWNLVQLCLDQCPTPFKFWRKLLLSKVQTCQTQ